MIELRYGQVYNKNTCLCLGFFDSLHIGHQSLIKEASCSKLDIGVFTFLDNPYRVVGSADKLILTYKERVSNLEAMGVDFIVGAIATREFFDTEPNDFLSKLITSLNVKKIVVGEDYAYGRSRTGNVHTLCEFCQKVGVEVLVLPLMLDGEHKIGTRYIRDMIESGRVDEAYSRLGYYYYISGEVRTGRRDGHKIGFPTANICIPETKVIPKDGVYACFTIVDGKRYKSIVNVGTHPTFGDMSTNIESHIIDFDKDIYGREVKVEFVYRLRDVFNFDSIVELKSQLTQDLDKAMEILR